MAYMSHRHCHRYRVSPTSAAVTGAGLNEAPAAEFRFEGPDGGVGVTCNVGRLRQRDAASGVVETDSYVVCVCV